MKESDTLRHIGKFLNAVLDTNQPSRDELRLLDRRNQLERELSDDPELFVNRYEEVCSYWLDEKLLKKFEWIIVLQLENNRDAFIESGFYKNFGEHETVRRAFSKYERIIMYLIKITCLISKTGTSITCLRK